MTVKRNLDIKASLDLHHATHWHMQGTLNTVQMQIAVEHQQALGGHREALGQRATLGPPATLGHQVILDRRAALGRRVSLGRRAALVDQGPQAAPDHPMVPE